MWFINTPALQVRASPVLEKPYDKSSDEILFTAEQIKTSQYLKIYKIQTLLNIVENFKVMKRCKQSEPYSLESILSEEERPKSNTPVALYEKKNNLLINIFSHTSTALAPISVQVLFDMIERSFNSWQVRWLRLLTWFNYLIFVYFYYEKLNLFQNVKLNFEHCLMLHEFFYYDITTIIFFILLYFQSLW